MASSPVAHFPSDYRAARAAFVAAADAAGLGITTRVHPHAKGPDGKPLFLDTAAAGARDAESALLLISGTHGVEGYFGSAAQTGLLREGLAARVPEGSKIVFLHALNPFGFAHDRRVNEDNADVNRNFVDHTHPPVNAAYETLAEAIAPRDISPAAIRAANARLRDFIGANGAFKLQEAISAGQYAHADGLYFGGAAQSWSAAMLKDVFKEEMAGVKKLTVIDFHTGLGDCGAAEMITEDVPGSTAYARAAALWGKVASSEAGESVSAPLTGTIDRGVKSWLDGVELTFAALEVGTRSLREVFDALRRDNWLYMFGSFDDERARAIKAEVRDAFYVETPEWKRSVWKHAENAVSRALQALA